MKARVWLLVASLALAGFVAVAASARSDPPTITNAVGVGSSGRDDPAATVRPPSVSSPPATRVATTRRTTTTPPGWHPRPVFRGRLMVAYYGTAGTASMGVLGSAPIPVMTHRLQHVAAEYAKASGRRVQIVYELIATMADSYPGPDGSYSHDIPRADVEAYLRAARRDHALVVLDLQPGRTDFLTAAKRYAWALREPDVGIALDPEWRMNGDEMPGKQIGWVDADEINATARYVAGIAREYRLPQKLFLIHQFTPITVGDIRDVRPMKGLAMVQHVDGWGTRVDKLATFHRVARPGEFTLGFKLFYRDDVDMFTPAQVLRAVPRVRYFSYQ